MGIYIFTLEELAAKVTGGNLAAMAKLLNDAGVTPRLDENNPSPAYKVERFDVIKVWADRAGDRVGRAVGGLLGTE